MLNLRKVRIQKAACPLRRGVPSRRKKGGVPMYVTYQDLTQIGILLVTLISLIYEIYKDKK